MPLQLRRGTEAERQLMEQPLAEGEPLFITDSNILYVGIRNLDGTMPMPRELISTQVYTDANAESVMVSLLENGSHPDLTYQYNTTQHTFDVRLELSELSQNIIPAVNSMYNLGSFSNKFKSLYLSGDHLWLGDANITATGSAINLPGGSTVAGTVIGSSSNIISSSTSNLTLVDIAANTLQTDKLILADNVISATDNEPLTLIADNYKVATTRIPISTSISDILQVSNYSDFNFMSTPVSGESYSSNDISSIIQFSASDDSAKIYGTVFVGSQIDPLQFTNEEYAASKFFISVLSEAFLDDGEVRHLTFDSRGYLAINHEIASATLDINGFMKLGILNDEPDYILNGMIAIADGHNWDPAGTGVQSLVVRLGDEWILIAAGATAPV